MQRPLVPLLFALMAGIYIGYTYEIPVSWLTLGLIPCTMLLFIFGWKGFSGLVPPVAIVVIFLFSALNIQFYLYRSPDPEHISHHAGPDILTVEGMVSTPPKQFPDRTQLVISAQRLHMHGSVVPVHGRILLSCTADKSFQYGQIIRFKTRLKIPRNFRNPGGYDYERNLLLKGILVHGFIRNPADIVLLRENRGQPVRMHLETFRHRLKTIIRSHGGSPAGEIMQALILGDQHEIPNSIRDQYSRAGVSHILAISGFHIGIIGLFSIMAIRLTMKASTYLLLRFNIIEVSTALSFVPVAVFTLVAGMGITVIRASIMALALLLALFLGKDRDPYHILALAAFVILIIWPPSLFDVSFQLSFSAVAAILFIAPKLTALIAKPPLDARGGFHGFVLRRLYDVALFIIITISATLGTMPLVVHYFNRISLITIPANLVIVPILGMLALPVSIAIIPASLLSTTLAEGLVNLSSFLINIALRAVEFFASIPWAAYYVATPGPAGMILYMLLIVFLFLLIENMANRRLILTTEGEPQIRRRWILKGILIGLTSLFFAHQLFDRYAVTQNSDLRVTAIDVGQGSSTLVQFPGGKTMLIDGGGYFNDEFDIGRYVVAPVLWDQKIHTIDVVVLTHAHPDHLNGLKFIVKNFNIGEVWSNGHEDNTESFRTFKKIIMERNIPFLHVSMASPPVRINNVTVRILNPMASACLTEDWNTYEGINAHSLVMKLTYGRIGILLPADISEATEAELVHRVGNIESDVLFVPHHGSRMSSTEPFLGAVKPHIAIISCGRENIFRLPHPDVLQRYDLRNVTVFRTDRDGAVSIATDGRDLRIHAFGQRKVKNFRNDLSPDSGV